MPKGVYLHKHVPWNKSRVGVMPIPWNKGLRYKGKPHSEETKKKISLAVVGKKRSIESRRRMSLSHIGGTPWNKGKGGYSTAKKGTTVTNPETLEKFRLAMSAVWTRPGFREKMVALHIGRPSHMKGKKAPWFTGPKNPRWKGGVTPINDKIRHSPEYINWRTSVFKRDNYTCVQCGSRGFVHADHILPFSLYPDLRFTLGNGRTLCVPCHVKTPTHGTKVFSSKKPID